MAKKTQLIMVWFLPLIVIGGIFFPALGYLMVAMLAFFLPFSYFRGRYWCWNLCPRGAFLDLAMSKVGAHKPVPKLFTRMWLRWSIFALFMTVMLYRLLSAGGNLVAIGAIFVSVCLITTVIAIILASFMKHRAWCTICPMGTLQEQIGKIKKQ